MKRIFAFLLALTLLLSTIGCSANTIETPANFYYLKKNYDFTGTNGVIAPEIIDATQYPTLNSFISAYLRGPKDLILTPPFPAGTLLIDIDQDGDTLVITLSDRFASLTGIELSLACCALAKTAIEFTNVSVIEIQALTAMLQGEQSITITGSDILLADSADISISSDQK